MSGAGQTGEPGKSAPIRLLRQGAAFAALFVLATQPGATAFSSPDLASSTAVEPALRKLLNHKPGWSEDFATRPGAPDWQRGYSPWVNAIAARVLLTGEMQVYIDAPYLNRDLLGWHPGLATLAAEPMTPIDRQAIDARIAKEQVPPKLAAPLLKARWVSTLLKGHRAFQYGYFEARIRSDLDPSEWDAFWLLPEKWQWPPEIDIMEIPGDRLAHQTVHSMPGDPLPHPTVKTPVGPGFHTYGVLWRPDWIMFFVDRHRTACFPTPADMHQPMYPLLNLAIGGWARKPDERTPPRITMDVSSVRWWALQPDQAAAGSRSSPACTA